MAVAEAGMLEGVFSLFAMAHTLTFAGPSGPQETVPWDGSARPGGSFTDASRSCSDDAPVNNVSTDLPTLGGAVDGGRAPVSTRTHPMRFDIVEDRDVTRLRGGITLVVCHLASGSTSVPDPTPDHRKPRIEVRWSAQVGARTGEQVSWQGTFEIVGGTATYAALRGEGDIGGCFSCSEARDDAARADLHDCQYAMIGRYRIPAAAVRSRQR